jgi:Tfp pilus assembly major pilin PilA
MDMGLLPMPAGSGFTWWQYVINGVIVILGGLILKYFEKVVLARNTHVSAEIREIRKLQKQGLITAAQADKKIEKLISSDTQTETDHVAP